MVPLLSLKQFLNDLRRQKMRTALTMFGIFWGTCAIVLLFAFGKGISDAQMKSQKGLGENIAIYWPGITSKEYKGLPKGRRVHFTEEDVALMKARGVTINRISPEYSRWSVTMKRGRKTFSKQLIGIWPEFAEMRNIIPQDGSRFLNEYDLAENRRVIFIGNRLKEDLFGSEDAIGERILLDDVPFTPAGLVAQGQRIEKKGGKGLTRCHQLLYIAVQ